MKMSKLKLTLNRFIKEEKANAQVVEYTIILPICLFLLALLFLGGFYLNQQAVLDSAVSRGVALAQRVYTDPNSSKLYNLGNSGEDYQVGVKINSSALTAGTLKSKPYRYMTHRKVFDEVYNEINKKIKNSVSTSQLIKTDTRLSDLQIERPKDFKGFVLFRTTITLKQEFKNPFVPKLLGESAGTWFEMSSTATATAMNVSEFVRTVDFLNDVCERFTGNDTGEWVQKLLDKVTTFLNKTS